MMMWKIVEASDASIIYIYIYMILTFLAPNDESVWISTMKII